MRPRPKLTLWTLATLAALAALAAGVSAAPPQETSWSPLDAEGSPVDAGFLAGGFVAYGTTDAGAISGQSAGFCSVDADDADLVLVTFPEGPGCKQALDTSDTQEGIVALDTSTESDLVVVGLPGDGSSSLSGPNVVAYELDEGNLSATWDRTLNGEVIDVATDPGASRAVVTFQTGNHDHRVRVISGAGDDQINVRVPGEPRAVSLSDNGRYLAVGGNTTQGNSSVGWAHLYDLTLPEDDNPVVDRTIPRPRAGIVVSAAATDHGRLYGGLLDGTVRLFRASADDAEVSLGTDPAYVDVDGSRAFASAGNETGELALQGGQLETRWRALVNGTSQATLARLPHVFAVAQTINGLGPDGDRIWETTSGTVVAANSTGLGLVVASPTTTGPQETDTSSLRGLVLQRNVTIQQDGPIRVSPGGARLANLTFSNSGAAVLNLTPRAEASDLTVTSIPPSFDVLPGRDRNVTFTIRADRGAEAGERRIPIDLQARPPVELDAGLDVQVTAQPNITLAFAGGQVGDQNVTQAQTLTVRLSLQNTGNADADVQVAVLQSVDEDWPVDVAPNSTVTVPGGSTTTVRLSITVPPGTPDGTTNRLILRGVTDTGGSAVQLNLTVNPFQVLRLRPHTISQQMAPGDTLPYDFSVENLGSVQANVRLSTQAIGPDGEPCLPGAWGVALAESGVIAPAQGSRPVRVEISAPAQIPVPGVANDTAPCTQDAQRPSLRVELKARSDAGAQAESLLFARVDPSLAEEQDRPKREPFPGVGVIAAVLGASAALVRRNQP